MSLVYLNEGVKPKCTDFRWFSARVDTQQHAIVIEEYFLDFLTASAIAKEQCTLSLPPFFDDRIIGRPTCIACRHDHLILQYSKFSSDHLHFIYFNMKTNTAQFFRDASKTFERGIAIMYSVECLINPSMKNALFRLPQPVMSDRKWSKLFITDISLKNGDLRFSDIHDSLLRDRENQAMAFNSQHPDQVTFILVDNYCAKAHLMNFDLQSRKTLHELKQSIASRQQRNPGLEGDSDEENVYYNLHQCNAAYSRSGDVLVLVCCVYGPYIPDEVMLKVCLFEAESLTLQSLRLQRIRNLPFPHRGLQSTKHWFYPVFSPSDEEVAVWFFEKHASPKVCSASLSLQKNLSLKKLCRAAICAALYPPGSLGSLPLPSQLCDFLKFNVN